MNAHKTGWLARTLLPAPSRQLTWSTSPAVHPRFTPPARDVHAITQHIAVHPRVLANTGRVFFGLAPDPTANL